MQGDDARHTPGIFDDIGMVASQHRTPLDHHRHVLGQNQVAPVRHHSIETPGRSMEKVQQLVIACLIHVPEATERGDRLDVVAANEAEDDRTAQGPGQMACKEGAKRREQLGKVAERRHRSPPVVQG